MGVIFSKFLAARYVVAAFNQVGIVMTESPNLSPDVMTDRIGQRCQVHNIDTLIQKAAEVKKKNNKKTGREQAKTQIKKNPQKQS